MENPVCLRCEIDDSVKSNPLDSIEHINTDEEGYEHYFCSQCIATLCLAWWKVTGKRLWEARERKAE